MPDAPGCCQVRLWRGAAVAVGTARACAVVRPLRLAAPLRGAAAGAAHPLLRRSAGRGGARAARRCSRRLGLDHCRAAHLRTGAPRPRHISAECIGLCLANTTLTLPARAELPPRGARGRRVHARGAVARHRGRKSGAAQPAARRGGGRSARGVSCAFARATAVTVCRGLVSSSHALVTTRCGRAMPAAAAAARGACGCAPPVHTAAACVCAQPQSDSHLAPRAKRVRRTHSCALCASSATPTSVDSSGRSSGTTGAPVSAMNTECVLVNWLKRSHSRMSSMMSRFSSVTASAGGGCQRAGVRSGKARESFGGGVPAAPPQAPALRRRGGARAVGAARRCFQASRAELWRRVRSSQRTRKLRAAGQWHALSHALSATSSTVLMVWARARSRPACAAGHGASVCGGAHEATKRDWTQAAADGTKTRSPSTLHQQLGNHSGGHGGNSAPCQHGGRVPPRRLTNDWSVEPARAGPVQLRSPSDSVS